jgi:hypothetical protein
MVGDQIWVKWRRSEKAHEISSLKAHNSQRLLGVSFSRPVGRRGDLRLLHPGTPSSSLEMIFLHRLRRHDLNRRYLERYMKTEVVKGEDARDGSYRDLEGPEYLLCG